MKKRGKKYIDALKNAEIENKYLALEDALKIVVDSHHVKFDESVDVAINLGIDVKKNDQQVRGSVLLPHGTGKMVKILVFAKGEKEREALAAGADYVGQEDMIAKVQQGFMDFNERHKIFFKLGGAKRNLAYRRLQNSVFLCFKFYVAFFQFFYYFAHIKSNSANFWVRH